MNARCSWLTMKWTSLRGSPMSARPCWLRGRSTGSCSTVSVLRADEQLGGVVLVVEERAVGLAPPVQGVEVEAGRAEGVEGVGVVRPVEARHRVEGDVVVDELAQVGVAGRDVRVVARRAPPAASAMDVGQRRQGWRREGANGRELAEHPPVAAVE